MISHDVWPLLRGPRGFCLDLGWGFLGLRRLHCKMGDCWFLGSGNNTAHQALGPRIALCLLLSTLQRGHGARVTCTTALQGLPVAPAHGPGVSDLCPQRFCQPPTSKAGPGHCVCLFCWSPPPHICILRPFMLPPTPRLAAVFQLCSPRSLPPAPRL